ncbi:cysteine hydrolase [Nitrosomonas sp.]|uniref:cysteine hydrolase family protein n=1 Tax=Nitrosomonas sp. TaxID=42353 RepID=UPI0033068EB8
MNFIPKNHTVHLCVDMQRLFTEETEWQTPWIHKILPQVLALTERVPEHTVFTRFIPVEKKGQGLGMWKKYYEHWDCMTLEKLDKRLIELLPQLARFVPPAEIIDKSVYGPWITTNLHQRLQHRRINTIVISGGEIDICVLATILGAVDLGYRVIAASDALCSYADKSYDSIMTVLKQRFSIQIEVEETEKILSSWP